MCFLHNFQKNKLMGLSRSRIQSFLSSSFERFFKNLKSFALPCINFSTILNISRSMSQGTFETTACISSPESCSCSVALDFSNNKKTHETKIMKSTKLYKKVYQSIHQLHFLEVQQ